MSTEKKTPPSPKTPDHRKMTSADRQALFRVWRNSPEKYFRQRLGVTKFWKGELAMLEALPRCIIDRKPLVVPSGHALGKDFTISGRATLWFAECFSPSKVIMTGPTDRQVKKIMWSELETAYNNRPIRDEFGELLTCELRIEKDWFILAFTTKETKGQEGKFQGAHSPHMMIVVSEAQAVDDVIYEQIDGITTSGIVLETYLGNPLRTTGRFAKMIDDKKNNIVINLDCLESPNVIEKREVIPGLCSHEWVEKHRKLWNADGSGKDPRWLARVRGIKPKTSINQVVSELMYDSAIGRQLFPKFKTGTIGVDPAEMGGDDFVISVFESGELKEEIAKPYCEPPEGCAYIQQAIAKWFPDGGCVVTIDCDGLGRPFHLFLKSMISVSDRNQKSLYQAVKLVEFYGSSTDKDVIDTQYANQRAECAFFAKQQLANGLISLDGSEYAREEALEETYYVNKAGRLQLEDKDDISARLGRSPDRWDARKLGIWGMKFAEPIVKRDGWRDRTNRSGNSSMLPPGKSYMGV